MDRWLPLLISVSLDVLCGRKEGGFVLFRYWPTEKTAIYSFVDDIDAKDFLRKETENKIMDEFKAVSLSDYSAVLNQIS